MSSNSLGLDEKEMITLSTYNHIGPKWSTTSDGVALDGSYLWEEEMKRFHELAAGTPSGDGRKQNLIEIASGTGRDAKLLSRFYNYTGFDVSEAFIEMARCNTSGMLPPDAFRLMSVYNLKDNFPPGSFDLFWACAALLHCSKHRMQEALTSIKSVLKDGALGFISMKEGDGEERDIWDKSPELSRYFLYWQDPEFRSELDQAGFKIIEFHKKISRKNFLCYFVRA